MWEYLARNLKADVNILVLLNLSVYRNCGPGVVSSAAVFGMSRNAPRAVTQHSLYRNLFNQNGMDFVTEYLSVKPRLLIKKGWFFWGVKSAREII